MECRVGDVVVAEYTTLSNEVKRGLFAIMYNEGYDASTNCDLNVMGLKVTTQDHDNYSYYVDITKGMANVDNDCRVCCSKTHVIHKAKIKAVIGHLPHYIMCDIINMYNKYNIEVNNQLCKELGGI